MYIIIFQALAEILAPILDICFGSSEKDKVNNILASLMCNIVPYLKTHTVKNMPSFNACSKLLSSLSSYQYTRKAWKKDVFDLLLDNTLFQMDYSCLKFWRVIVDNLMTHDNTTFRDLMSKFFFRFFVIGIFCSEYFFRSRFNDSKWDVRNLFFEGTRVRAKGPTIKKIGLCNILQRNRPICQVYA